jgi:hypothetical protein
MFMPPMGLPMRSPDHGAMNTNPAIKERRCLVQSLAQPMHPTTKSVIYYWR